MQLQYIGARYRPIFYQNSVDQTANWEVNVEYEPLTFVTTQNNHLYLSKKTVPDNIGTPAQNTEYWLDMGIFTDAQIAEVVEELENLETRVGENANLSTIDKSTLVAAINEVFSNVGDINDLPYPQADNVIRTLNWIADVIEELRDYTNAQLATKVDKRKFAIITDSYGGSFGGTIVPFTTRFMNDMGLTEGVDFCSKYLDGAGFVSDGRLFITPLEQLAANMPGDMVPSDITDLLVLGGCNDSGITSGLGNGIADFVTRAKQLFPNAKISVGCIGGLNTTAGRVRILKNVLPYYSFAGNYGANFLPNLQYVMTNKNFFQSDGVHPTQAGMNYIGQALASAVQHGTAVHYNTPISFTKDSAFATGGITSGTVYISNDLTEILINGLHVEYSSAQTKAQGNIVLGTISNDNFIGNLDIWIPVQPSYSGGSSGTRICTDMLAITDGQLILVTSAQWNFKNIGFSRISASMPTLLC